MVPVVGLEPTRGISPTDFESVTSTNSITPAYFLFGFLLYRLFPWSARDFFRAGSPQPLDKTLPLVYNISIVKSFDFTFRHQGGILVKNQAYRMALLYDFYGDMLTDRQKEFYDLYYNEDLSLSEIAENYSISRQGVRDVIVRAEATLTELEDKTGIIRRFHVMQDELRGLLADVDAIAQRNAAQYRDDEIEALTERISSVLNKLKQE